MANKKDWSTVLKPCVELPIQEKTLMKVIDNARDFAQMYGACMRPAADSNKDTLQFVKFVLTPSTLPRKEFERALHLQPILNELIHKVAHNYEFLRETLKETIKVDQFTGKLFEIYEKVRNDEKSQPISLGMLRSDVMLDTGSDLTWKQVEINTISSGFGHLGPISRTLQSYILGELGHYDKLKDLPENKALSGLAGALVDAWKFINKPQAAILFVIEEVSYNICDQRFHEFQIRKSSPQTRVIRKTLTQIAKEGKLGPNRELIVDGNEVSVVYFRAGYEPNQYPGEEEWNARLMMEQSMAIKCPSIQYHLSGTKKVQQALAKPGVLKRFLNDPKDISEVESIFTGLYSLDCNEEGDKAVKMALADPERFVMKPQREGGGNNIYGKDIVNALSEIAPAERSAWILMDRIRPPITRNYIVRPGQIGPPEIVDLVSELGIFGVVLGDKRKIITNYQAGHMFRTKLANADEGGVMAGAGALDSPYLI